MLSIISLSIQKGHFKKLKKSYNLWSLQEAISL